MLFDGKGSRLLLTDAINSTLTTPGFYLHTDIKTSQQRTFSNVPDVWQIQDGLILFVLKVIGEQNVDDMNTIRPVGMSSQVETMDRNTQTHPVGVDGFPVQRAPDWHVSRVQIDGEETFGILIRTRAGESEDVVSGLLWGNHLHKHTRLIGDCKDKNMYNSKV